MKDALGAIKQYGSAEGMESDDIRKYHYMLGMEYFDEPSVLAEYKSYDRAVASVEKALAVEKSGVSKVYRIDVPGKNETVFGVHLTADCGGEKFVMRHIDFKPVRSTAHLPCWFRVTRCMRYMPVFVLLLTFRI